MTTTHTRVALITGAGTGIGKAAAKALHGAGYAVVLTGRKLDKLEAALRHTEMRAVDTFALLFDREIDETVYGLATGEAQAHLRYLHFAGRIKCEIRDGVGWYHAA